MWKTSAGNDTSASRQGPVRVLVTGSRDWPDRTAVFAALDEVATTHPGRDIVVVHGACPTGADIDAHAWYLSRRHIGAMRGVTVTEEPYPADWSRGRGAGPLRNEKMVELGADVCLAFISECTSPRCTVPGVHDSHGASGCADLAVHAGIETRRFTAS